MKGRLMQVLVMLLFAAALSDAVEPLPKKSTEIINLSLLDISQREKPTVESNEIETVSIPDEENWDEDFCDSLEILAQCVEAEAGNQDLKGKRLVCDVILNRVDSDRFPDDIEAVISQKYHFSTYWDGTMSRIVPSEETFKAVQMEIYGERLDGNILFFTAENYNTYCVPGYTYGDHYFGY